MKKILCILGLALLWSAGSALPVHAQSQASDVRSYTFIFNDADIPRVAEEILGQTLGVSYRVEPGVSGRMNFRIDQQLSPRQLLAAFEAALATLNVVIVQEGETLVLRSRDAAAGTGFIGGASASGIGFQIRAVPVKYGLASEIGKALTSITSAKIVLYSSDDLGLILLGGRNEELDNAVSTIAMFDQSPLAENRIRYIPLRNAGAGSVAEELGGIFKASGVNGITLMPLPRMNALLVFSRAPETLSEIEGWVARLDVPSEDASIRTWVYRPRGASAQSLAQTLNQAMGLTGAQVDSGAATSATSTPASGSQPMPDGNATVRIVADKETNTIIINAPEATRIRILNLLNEIDREPAQIFIEASILEVSLTNDFSYGVDWKQIASNGDLTISSYSSDSVAMAPIAPGFSINYLGTDISAAVRALSARSKVRIVSAPKIMTVENGTALLSVGDQVPIVTQSSQGTATAGAPLINTIDYRDTGVMLEVTPRISGADRVSLTVVQEVSSVAKTQTSGIDSPTIKQRRMESRLIVPEGTVVAMGGLISSSENEGRSGVPGLMNIPVLGALFSGNTRTGDRTELVVLLQVRIIRNPSDYGGLLTNLHTDLKDMMNAGSWLYIP